MVSSLPATLAQFCTAAFGRPFTSSLTSASLPSRQSLYILHISEDIYKNRDENGEKTFKLRLSTSLQLNYTVLANNHLQHLIVNFFFTSCVQLQYSCITLFSKF